MSTFYAEKTPTFSCVNCHFECRKKSDYNRHIVTAKHKKMTSMSTFYAERTNSSSLQYVCSCGKSYKSRQSLYRHRRSCTVNTEPLFNQNTTYENNNSNSHINNDTVNAILQDNLEMRKALVQQSELYQQQMKEQQEQHNKQIQELIPKLQQVTTINNNSNNTTTNKFNLNFFLNEQCKDAISIQTFIENLDIGIKELEHMGNVGYLQGMMTIMSNTLGAMDVYKRPVHCTDLKRETVYIKDGDTWKKDNANNDDLRRVINTVANVNYRNLDVWESQHPDAFESDTPDNIEYCKIAMESLGGYDNSDDKIAIKLNKLVKHVVREVYVK